MKSEEIIAKIERIINKELEINTKNIKPNKTLLELGIDSIRFMTLVVYLEEEMSIEIDFMNGLEEEYSKNTIDTLVCLIRKEVEQQ